MRSIRKKRLVQFVYGLAISLCVLKFIDDQLSPDCGSPEEEIQFSTLTNKRAEKPILLMWFMPLGMKINLTKDCKTYFNIDGCVITDDRSLYEQADAVLFFHKSIKWNLSNLPQGHRPPFQRWIWYNVESPTNTGRKANMEDFFNLTLTYRRDLSITARYELNIVRDEERFVLPLKDKMVCWIVSNSMTKTGASIRVNYYEELKKYVNVTVYGRRFQNFLRYEDYFPTLASCKFYLSFENSIHKDYITEKLNGPLVAGTVPIVLGTSRENYEQFIPSDSFIHVDDFPNPKALAEYLLQLNQNNDMYMQYFTWRKHFKATPHLLSRENEFTQPICVACDHIAKDSSFSVHQDLTWWFSSN